MRTNWMRALPYGGEESSSLYAGTPRPIPDPLYIIDMKKLTMSDQLLLVNCVLGVLRTEVGPPFHCFSLLFHTLLPMSLRVNLVGGLRERH